MDEIESIALGDGGLVKAHGYENVYHENEI